MKIREIEIDGDVAYVPLSRGYRAIIDAADVNIVAGRNWTAHVHPHRHGVYATGTKTINGKRRTFYLHRLICPTGEGLQVDHINGDTLDNRRANLRPATFGQNQRNRKKYANNSSGYKGVFYNAKSGSWRAAVRVNGRRVTVGSFATREEAAAAYESAAQVIHGRFSGSPADDPLRYSYGILWRALADILELGLDVENQAIRRVVEIVEEAMWHDTYSDFKPTPRVYQFHSRNR